MSNIIQIELQNDKDKNERYMKCTYWKNRWYFITNNNFSFEIICSYREDSVKNTINLL